MLRIWQMAEIGLVAPTPDPLHILSQQVEDIHYSK